MELIFFIIIPLMLVAAAVSFRVFPYVRLNPIPAAGLLVVLTGSVLGHQFFNKPVGPIPITLDRLLLIFATLWFGYLVLDGREQLRSLNWLDKSILILLAVIGLSTIAHDFKYAGNMPLSRLLFFNVMPAGLYYLVRSCRLSAGDLKFIAVILSLFGVYLGLTALCETKGMTGLVFPRYIMTSEIREFLGRGRGPFLNPVTNGIFMTTCFCCTLMWWPRSNDVGRLLLILVATVIMLGVYLTLTRSVWLGFIGACAVFIFWPSGRQHKGLMIVGATVVGIILFPVLSEKLFSFKRDKEVSVSEMQISAQMRPMFFIVATNMFKDRPVLGVGYGQYPKAKHPYLKDPHTNMPLTITKTLMQHNVFLAYLTETGLVGVTVLVFMIFMMFYVGWQVWNDLSLDLWARQFGLMAVVMMACYCLNGLFHDVSIIPMQHVYMFFLLGLVNNIHTNRSPFRETQSPDDQTGKELIVAPIPNHVRIQEPLVDEPSVNPREHVRIGG